MSKITEERLNRVKYAVENGLSRSIHQRPEGYYVCHPLAISMCEPVATLEEAILEWDRQERDREQADELGLTRVDDVDLDDFEGQCDGGGLRHYEDDAPYEDTPDTPSNWDDYEFDEDGYKRRRQ